MNTRLLVVSDLRIDVLNYRGLSAANPVPSRLCRIGVPRQQRPSWRNSTVAVAFELLACVDIIIESVV